jgi:hypothetical protein
MANGVATLSLGRIGTSVFSQGQLVTQLGAVSVANPDGNARPESVEFYVSASFTNVTLRERSSLVPLGTNVLAWPDDYQVLAGLMQKVARGYSQFDTNRDMIRLDLEYKKIQPGRLEVKQVREVPLPDSTNRAPTFLLGAPEQPTEFAVYGPSFAVHRAKSRWRLFTTNLALQATNLAQTFYPSAQVDFVATSNPFYLDGSPSDWPGAWHAVSNNPAANTWKVSDGWVFGAGIQRREFTLATELNRTVSEAESPLLTLADARLELRIQYAHLMPAADSGGNITSVDEETVQLFRQPPHDTNPPVPVTLTTNGLTIVASHRMGNVYGPPSTPLICLSPISTKASYAQASLDGETTIEGLLSKPLTLRNPASQTFLVRGRQGHERIEELVWDPWLEPGLSAELRSELTSANIGLLYFRSYTFGRREESIQILGLDGVVRPW